MLPVPAPPPSPPSPRIFFPSPRFFALSILLGIFLCSPFVSISRFLVFSFLFSVSYFYAGLSGSYFFFFSQRVDNGYFNVECLKEEENFLEGII